ncbi:MAG: hypothetical protein ACD_62C00285G0003 [uncultured bacterium]|nr:MAG: hypothetical protein ACD_62C00285G0003 [uncultured bacterium]
MHEPTFRRALANAGLNPYLFEMANIREHDSWVHEDRAQATEKALDLVSAAISRVAYHEVLDSRTVSINPATMVVGGGIAGMSAALEIANAGKKVFLVERTNKLGGLMSHLDGAYQDFHDISRSLNVKVEQVQKHPQISVYLNSELKDVFGYIGNFEAKITQQGKDVDLKFGNIIMATGLKTFDPTVIPEYGYGKLANVVTSVDFERMLKNGKVHTKAGQTPKSVAIIHCVGSRNEKYHEYCSRNCCMTALKYSVQLKKALPKTRVYDLYADMRAFGKCGEDLYRQASENKVLFMMFDQQEGLPLISQSQEGDGAGLTITINDKLSQETLEVPADMVVLMVGVEAQADAKQMSHFVGISLCGHDFFIEKHPKLDPVATTTSGVYIVGSCQGPKDIPDSVSQARAASARVLGTICKGNVAVEVTTACVNEELCCGCQTCVTVCPYSAVSFNAEKKVSVVNEVLCKGCGTCGAGCPSGAIRCRHFTDEQIMSQIEGLLGFVA